MGDGGKVLYGPDGKPINSGSRKGKGKLSALDALSQMGVVQDDNGNLVVPKNVLKRVRNEDLRRVAISSVPSTPRYMLRDAGGVGVPKGGGMHPSPITMQTLRRLRERAAILNSIHSARTYQIRRMARPWPGKKGEVGYRVVHKDHYESNAEPPESIKPFIKRFASMLDRPSPSYKINTLGTFLTLCWEDLATINRPVVEVIHSLIEPDRVVQFRPVDGAIVWETLLWAEKWKNDNPNWNRGYEAAALTADQELDLVSHAIGWDLHGSDYALVRDGVLESVFPPHKLIVAPIRNRTDVNTTNYPPSHVEQALEIIATFINTWDYNAHYFTRGMLAEFAIGVSGDLHDEDIDAFVDMLRESTQGVQQAWQPPIIPLPIDGAISKIDFKANNREMMFETWLSLLIASLCAIYRMDTSTINAKPWDGGGGGGLSEPSRHDEIALAKEEGLQGDIQHLTDNILNPLARRCHPDLRVIWEYGDFDPHKEAQIYEIRSKVEMTRNDVRMAQGMTPMGFWVPSEEVKDLSDEDETEYNTNIWNWPADPGFASAVNQAAQLKQQSEQMAQYGGGGEPGAPPGEPPPGEEGQPPPDEGDGFGGPAEAQDDGFGQPAGQAPYGQPPMEKGRRATGWPTPTVYVHEQD